MKPTEVKLKFRRGKKLFTTLAGILSLGILAGCSQGPSSSTPPITAQDRIPLPSVYPALRGTVGQYVGLGFSGPIVVRGWGLVANLPNTGSGQMPPPIRKVMLNRLLRAGVGFYTSGLGNIDPNQILNSKQVAAVAVEGAIPPLAVAGTTFDVYLKALPNTGTTSLKNGLLWPVGLRVHIRLVDQSEVLARARGPVFCNPFTSTGALKPANAIVREGRVIGGAMVEHSVPAVLELYNPSYRITDLVQRVINQHYGNYPAVATAENDRVVKVRIIHRYRHDPMRFIRRIMNLYLAGNVPGFNNHQAQVIIKSLHDPAAPHASLGVALEQLGRPILPILMKHYHSSNPAVAYYCLQAGARLGDSDAITAISKIALDTASPFERKAVYTLSHCHDRFLAGVTFRKLLRSASRRVQIMGYRALLTIHSSIVYSQEISQKFFMDIVPGTQKCTVYVTTHRVPRIAFLGRIPKLAPGALYISPHDALTVNYLPAPAAGAAGKKSVQAGGPVELYYRNALTGQTVSMRCGAALPAIVAMLAGAPNPYGKHFNPHEPFIGASYQRVVEMIYSLCHSGQVDAHFQMETITGKNRALMASLNQPRPSHSTMQPTVAAGTTTKPTSTPFSTSLPGELPAGSQSGSGH
jgi:hypothetical protein